MTQIRFASTVAAFFATGGMAFAACATDEDVATFVADWQSSTPTMALSAGGTMDDAMCTAAKVRTAMEAVLGPVVGYKAGLTSKPAMAAFGVSEPVMGVLYEKMMLDDGATVPAAFGARPLFDADLILVVGDAGINEATTHADVMAHVSAVHPFIELPDLMYAEGQPLDATTITAGGVGVRLGVLGAAIAVDDPEAMVSAMGSMVARVVNTAGTEMSAAPGASVLGNPAESALWLMSKGVVFEPGDLISVGSIGPLMPPAKAAGGATVTYEGLPGNPTVSVVFE